MTWTSDYALGQPVKVRFQGNWARAQVISIRTRSVMALILRGSGQQTTNIHDPRNIQPCQAPKTVNNKLMLTEQKLLNL